MGWRFAATGEATEKEMPFHWLHADTHTGRALVLLDKVIIIHSIRRLCRAVFYCWPATFAASVIILSLSLSPKKDTTSTTPSRRAPLRTPTSGRAKISKVNCNHQQSTPGSKAVYFSGETTQSHLFNGRRSKPIDLLELLRLHSRNLIFLVEFLSKSNKK